MSTQDDPIAAHMGMLFQHFGSAEAVIEAVMNSTRSKVSAPKPTPEPPPCENGENCGCAIGTRHFWFDAFCREREKLKAQPTPEPTPALELLAAKWRNQASLLEQSTERYGLICANEIRNCARQLTELIAASVSSDSTPAK